MSIPVNTGNATVTYEGNGTTSLFAIPFAFATAGEIAVYVNEAPAAGVTVFGAGDPFGGTASFAAAPAIGDVLHIRRLQTAHVSSNDTTARTLVDKLVAGDGIQITEQNDGGDETLQIAVIDGLIPPGLVSSYAGSTAPAGWLFCDGAAISRENFAALFAVIGTTYGAGDGTDTFNLPDLRGRVAAGRDDMGGSVAGRLTAGSAAGLDGSTLGAAGGVQQHQISILEMPAHHHTLRYRANLANGGNNVEIADYSVGLPLELNTSAVGGDQPHTNVQPTLILNYIIKA